MSIILQLFETYQNIGSYLETTEMEHVYVYGTIAIFLEVIRSYEMNKQVKMM